MRTDTNRFAILLRWCVSVKQKRFEEAYLSTFCMEWHLIVRAGLSFQEGAALLLAEESHPAKKAALQEIYRYLERGDSLADAFRQAGCFPHYAVEMVRIGQMTGRLEHVFCALANYYERVVQIRQSVHNIIWYPMILLALMLFVILILLVKVMPIFADVFAQLGAELSPMAALMLSAGQWLGQYGLYVLLFLVGGGLVLFIGYKIGVLTRACNESMHRVASRWQVSRLLASAKLADALVLTLSGGLNIDEALELAGQLIEDDTTKEKISACKKAMLVEGASFADAALAQQLFAPMYCRMLAVGFRTGDIDTVMAEVARRVAEDADQAMDALLNRIEPALVIVLSLMVGVILLSVMLPLMGIMTAIG